MPRTEILTPDQRADLLAFPDDDGELIRLATLSRSELAYIHQHRGLANRLGIAVQLVYLRHLCKKLGVREVPHPGVLGAVSTQLRIAPASWDAYAARSATRREHLLELFKRLPLTVYGLLHERALLEHLLPVAMQTTHGHVIAQAAVEELRRRHLVLPPIAKLERLCSTVATRAQREIHRLLVDPLNAEHRRALDALLSPRKDGPLSTLAWLRRSPGPPSARAVLAHIDRLQSIRDLNLPADIGRNIHPNRLARLAREGAQTAVYHLHDFEAERRYATLVAILLDTAATITDETFNLHDRLIGSFFTRVKHKYDSRFAADGKAVNEKVRLYAQIGSALIASKASGSDPFKAIEKILPWDRFAQSVQEAEQLARDEEFDSLSLLVEHFGQLRRYLPTLLDTFEFRGAPASKEILAAVEVLRDMNRARARKVPHDAPVAFVRARWKPFVFTEAGVDRRYYELAVVSELKNALRSGDVSVPGSRQFKDFDEYLLPRTAFLSAHDEGRLGLPVATSASVYIEDRLERLRKALDVTSKLAVADELLDVSLDEKGLKVSPIEDETPEEAEPLKQQAYALLPRVRITDLLLEVDRWTNFTAAFSHLKSGEEHPDRILLLTAILADAFNLGLEKMADACPGTSFAKLSWLAAWYIRDETYSQGLAQLVNFQHRAPFAAHWGEGTTSSSDGQRFRAGGHGESGGYRNAKYGDEPGVLFYTHVSDQYAPFHVKVINSPVRDATHVLDGLLYHESELQIEEHYTDTAGFTDHVFGLCHLLGFAFAPRIADLADKKLYVPGSVGQWPALATLVGAPIQTKLIERQFSEILRLAASIKEGVVTASLILRKLSAYPRQNGLAVALREVGRLERSLFMLQWLQEPALRRRVSAGLNKGEARNSLARAVFFHRLGEIRDRTYENQRYRASGLNLVVAAIILWNTVYLGRVVEALRRRRDVDESLLRHIAPLGWNHINLTGDYVWQADRRVAQGRFRPLRQTGASTKQRSQA